MMLLIILNWLASLLTIIGTLEVSRKTPHPLKINILYCIASTILLFLFILYQNWAMVFMYSILDVIAIKGIVTHK